MKQSALESRDDSRSPVPSNGAQVNAPPYEVTRKESPQISCSLRRCPSSHKRWTPLHLNENACDTLESGVTPHHRAYLMTYHLGAPATASSPKLYPLHTNRCQHTRSSSKLNQSPSFIPCLIRPTLLLLLFQNNEPAAHVVAGHTLLCRVDHHQMGIAVAFT